MVKANWTNKRKQWRDKQSEMLSKAILAEPELTTLIKAIKRPSVITILGHRGNGKSVLAYEIASQLHAKYGMPGDTYLPPQLQHLQGRLQKLLPPWMRCIASFKGFRRGAVAIIDEASQTAHARRSQATDSIQMDALVGIARQNEAVVLFISHVSRKLDISLIMESDLVLWKAPTMAHALFERDEVADFTFKALDFFKKLTGKEKLQTTLVMDFANLKFSYFRNGLPKFWTEELSTVYQK